ncbi:MAG: DNA-directed RNA polymerase subunit omega [Tissierellia bacterium]|nr:DNA-directed RNA polymerase subunit omega [Tissierellia bacterium]
MYIPSFEQIKKVDNSKYRLALMVAQRARQLNDENVEVYVDADDKNNVTIAMEEIIEGHIVGDK